MLLRSWEHIKGNVLCSLDPNQHVARQWPVVLTVSLQTLLISKERVFVAKLVQNN